MRSIAAVLGAIAVSCAVSASPAIARADGELAAEATFAEGRALMKEGRYPEACAKFEISLKLDRAAGTEVNLAECYLKLGKTASAWLRYRDGAAIAEQAGAKERAAEARDRAAKLEPSLCKLVVRIEGVVASSAYITNDGERLDPVLWGVAVPVDPGAHSIEEWVTNSGHVARSVTIAAAQEGVACPTAEVVLPAIAAPPIIVEPPPKPRGGTQRVAGAVLFGAGIVAAGVGAGFGVAALSTKNGADCDAIACSSIGRADLASAGRSADVATAEIVSGAILVVTGAAIYLTAPKTPRQLARAGVFRFR